MGRDDANANEDNAIDLYLTALINGEMEIDQHCLRKCFEDKRRHRDIFTFGFNLIKSLMLSFVCFFVFTSASSIVAFHFVQAYLSILYFGIKFALESQYINETNFGAMMKKKSEKLEHAGRDWVHDLFESFPVHRIAVNYARQMVSSSNRFYGNSREEITEVNPVLKLFETGNRKRSVGYCEGSLGEKEVINSQKSELKTSEKVDWLNLGKRIGMKIIDNSSQIISLDGDIGEDPKSTYSEEDNGPLTDLNSSENFRSSLKEEHQSKSFSVPTKPVHPMWTSSSNPEVSSESSKVWVGGPGKLMVDLSQMDSNNCEVPERKSLSELDKNPDCSLTSQECVAINSPKMRLDNNEVREVSTAIGYPLEIIAHDDAESVSEAAKSSSTFHAESILSGVDACSIFSSMQRSDFSNSQFGRKSFSIRSKLNRAFDSQRMKRSRHPAIEVKFQDNTKYRGSSSSPSSHAGHVRLKSLRCLEKGTKVLVPICGRNHSNSCQLATVISCEKVFIPGLSKWSQKYWKVSDEQNRRPNATYLRVHLDKSFLRDGKFCEIHLRIPDGSCMPIHSAYPIGSCVLTKFGIGVLVAWRVTDDIHVIRSLWNRRGSGSAIAYLRRDSLLRKVKACVGFTVKTSYGDGKVVGFRSSHQQGNAVRFVVLLKSESNSTTNVPSRKLCSEKQIISCPSASFVPICEQIKDAALFQIQVDEYKLAMRSESRRSTIDSTLFLWTENLELLGHGLVRAVEETSNLDNDVLSLLSALIKFFEHFGTSNFDENEADPLKTSKEYDDVLDETSSNGLWLLDDALGITRHNKQRSPSRRTASSTFTFCFAQNFSLVFDILTRAFSYAIADASKLGKVDFVMGLQISLQILSIVGAFLRVRQKESYTSKKAREAVMQEMASIFFPLNERFIKMGNGVNDRLHAHGEKAWRKASKFIEIILNDDEFFSCIEKKNVQGIVSLSRNAAISTKIVNDKSWDQLYLGAQYAFAALAPKIKTNNAANKVSEKGGFVSIFTFAFKWATRIFAAPRRSLLKLIASDGFQELCECIFVRVFQNSNDATTTLNIYASSFRSIRDLRVLQNVHVAGKIWLNLFEASNEELCWKVSSLPPSTRKYGELISKLVTLGVMHFHLVVNGDAKNWIDFLFETEAVELIHQIDMKVIEDLDLLCEEIKGTINDLPYYNKIDEDILTFLDGVNVQDIFKEGLSTLGKGGDFVLFLKEKSEQFLDHIMAYLPKMHIPIERKDVGEGWVLTCRGANHKDPLQLSSVQLKRENLACRVLGSGNLFSPFSVTAETPRKDFDDDTSNERDDEIRPKSILDNIRDLLLNAQKYGCWVEGHGGVGMVPLNPSIRRALGGLPVSAILYSAIELWEDMQMDDDELMEIAIRDVSYQIRLHNDEKHHNSIPTTPLRKAKISEESRSPRRLFNPRKDPTVLCLKLTGLTCRLDTFSFRVEPKEPISQYDPVFEGTGSLAIEDASINVTIECLKKKDMVTKSLVPIFVLKEYDFELESIDLSFQETGFDWVLNYAIVGFREIISDLVAQNMKEGVRYQICNSLDNLNEVARNNADVILKLLGIHIEDLELQ